MEHRRRVRVPLGVERTQRLLTDEVAVLLAGHPDCQGVETLPSGTLVAIFTGEVVGATDHAVCLVVKPESDPANRRVRWRDVSATEGEAALDALPMDRVGHVTLIAVEVDFRLSGGGRETTLNLVATVQGADRSSWLKQFIGRFHGAVAKRRERVWVEALVSGIVSGLKRLGA